MNDYINLNTEALSAEIERLRKISERLEDIKNKVNRETIVLKDNWQTHKSEVTFSGLNTVDLSLQDIKTNIDSEISFLENVVKGSYVDFERTQKESIEEVL